MKRGLKPDVVIWRAALMSLALVGCGAETGDSTPSGAAPLPEAVLPGGEATPDTDAARSALAPAGWVTVANQYQSFTLDAPSTVRFGVGDAWVTKQLPAGRVYCFFNPDPAPGQFKTCQRSTATDPVGGGTISPACAAFYAPDFALSSARVANPIPPLAKPTKGVAVSEPTYKTCLVRATDYKADGISGFARNDYSRRQAFNANSTKQLVYGYNDGTWNVYDANSRAFLKRLSGPASDAEPQWHPANPDLLYHLPTNGVGMKLHELNVSTGATRVVGDFGARLKARWPTAAAAWTRNEGSPSADRRYWCFMVDDANWGSLGVFTWDRDTNTILGWYDTHGERPDHVSMSPSGNSCVVSGDGALGTAAFSRDFSKKTPLHFKSEHSDIALDTNGDDLYVAVDYSGNGSVFMVNLRTGVRTDLFPTYVAGTATALHISGKAFARPGWVVVSTYADYGGALQWLHRKVMAVQLKANPTIYTLAHHRSKGNHEESDYWPEPHASVNLDFTRVAFSSNWNSTNDFDVDTYVVEIPVGALK